MRQIPNSFSVEFINVTPLNDFISECDIKVFYLGKNRNGSFISKPVGEAIARTLPNTPIVGFIKEATQDFGGHEKQMVIDDEGLHFTSKTFPYGVVSEAQPISWQEFQDYDGATRTYLVCHGYLWTGRYPEIQELVQQEKGQSMEFFPESIQGTWAKLNNENEETFIFSEASFSALCFLGDAVEPCFEGASISTRTNFTLDEKESAEFKEDFAKFMFELKETLNTKEGGNTELDTTISNTEALNGLYTADTTTGLANTVTITPADTLVDVTVYNTDTISTDSIAVESVVTYSEEEYNTLNDSYTALQTEHEELNSTYSQLNEKYEALVADYAALEEKYNTVSAQFETLNAQEQDRISAEKDELFSKFSMLNEEIIDSLKERKSEFTVEQLDEKLSAIAFKAGVTFALDTNDVITPIVEDSAPQVRAEWLQAIVNNKNKE